MKTGTIAGFIFISILLGILLYAKKKQRDTETTFISEISTFKNTLVKLDEENPCMKNVDDLQKQQQALLTKYYEIKNSILTDSEALQQIEALIVDIDKQLSSVVLCKNVKNCMVGNWSATGYIGCNGVSYTGIAYITRPITQVNTKGGQQCPSVRLEWPSECPNVNCEVSDWSTTVYTGCNGVSYTGVQYQTRTITRSPKGSGVCPPLTRDIIYNCPVNCVVGAWGSTTYYTGCNGVSYTGTTYQQRTVIQPSRYGGTGCPPLIQTIGNYSCVYNCETTDWSPTGYTGCNGLSYTGIKSQLRTIKIQPTLGGTGCPELLRKDTYTCSTYCEVGDWSSPRYTGCNGVSYTGVQYQTRIVTRSAGNPVCPPLRKENSYTCDILLVGNAIYMSSATLGLMLNNTANTNIRLNSVSFGEFYFFGVNYIYKYISWNTNNALIFSDTYNIPITGWTQTTGKAILLGYAPRGEVTVKSSYPYNNQYIHIQSADMELHIKLIRGTVYQYIEVRTTTKPSIGGIWNITDGTTFQNTFGNFTNVTAGESFVLRSDLNGYNWTFFNNHYVSI